MIQKISKTNIIKFSLLLALMQSTVLASSGYLWPTDASKTLTAVFGEIRPFRYHTGIDIRTYGINGHEIYAIEDGYIEKIKPTT